MSLYVGLDKDIGVPVLSISFQGCALKAEIKEAYLQQR